MLSRNFCGIFIFTAILLQVLSVAQQQQQPSQQQQDQCNDPQTQKECQKLKLENCIKNQVHQSDSVKSECQNGCSQFLGSNATAAIECLNNYDFDKLNQKLKIMECVEADVTSGRTGLGMTLPIITVNASDVMQMKVNQAVVKGFVPLKSYKTCMKNCMKRSSYIGTTTTKPKKEQQQQQQQQQKLGKLTKINDCHVQVYGRPAPSFEDKTLKRMAKLCSAQYKMDKTVATSRLAQCLQSAFSGSSAPADQQSKQEKCDCSKAKGEKIEL